MDFFKKHSLLFVVFITGASVLIIEIVAVRILSPYYGNTIFTVSSVISVILAALSLGYYIGGKLADRHPSLQQFFSIILISGLSVLFLQFLNLTFLPVLGYKLSITSGPLIFAIILFFLPAFLLGTLSPFAIKLQKLRFPTEGVGSVVGNVFFWSTLGSIFGSLVAGFVLIPQFGINQIIISTGVLLLLIGLIPLFLLGVVKKIVSPVILIVLATGALTFISFHQSRTDVVYSSDGIYEKITIYDGQSSGRPTRFFQQDRSNSGAMFLDSNDPTDLVFDYTKYYSLYKIFTPDVKNALVIGGGAYSIPKALLQELPNATVDVSEIEPSLLDLAREYFRVTDNPRLHNFVEDGRRFLHDSNKRYNLIFSDVYYSFFSVPSHFTTQEFFAIVKEKLSEDGVFIASMIGDLSRQQPSLIMSEIKTFQTVFPNSYFFAVTSPERTDLQNIIFVGYNSDREINVSSPLLVQHPDPIIRSLQNKIIDVERFDLSPYPILTDNFSPVEYLTAQVLQKNLGESTLFDGKEMLALIDQQLRYGPRYLSATGHKKVQRFLLAEMKELAQEVETQTWEHISTGGKKYELTNIIGRLYPTQERRIVLATHYDSKKLAGKDRKRPDQPVPGANDSASGVAVLVELVRILTNSQVVPNIGIDIVFFDGEEGEEDQGEDYTYWKPLGSTYFVEHLNELYGDSKPIAGIVLDMVCDKDLRILKERSSVQNTPAQVEIFWDIGRKVNESVFQNQVGQEIQNDHTPLNQVGIPSFLVIDFEYPYFHTTNDTLDKCSVKSMETVANAVFDYLYIIE